VSDLFERARSLIPGGVSSPARAFGAVGGDPVFAASAEGAYITATDGTRYIDYIQGFGAVILGHTHPAVTEAVQKAASRGGAVGLGTEAEVKLARLVSERVPSVERIRFVASGTEASMTAARIARAVTDRPVIVKFEGCYHGHADAFLAKAGSGVATFSVPMAAGVPAGSVQDTVVLQFNDVRTLKVLFDDHGGEIAAVFVEPVAANMGVVLPDREFLECIIELCQAHKSVSIFDEVVTGFRIGTGGAQAGFGLTPDLTMLGKVLGGGLPVGAIGGRADLMESLAPIGTVYQAGTYAAHPHAMAAGAAVLEALSEDDYDALEATAAQLAEGLSAAAKDAGVEVSVVRAETFLTVFFRAEAPRTFGDVMESDRDAFARFHGAMRRRGVLLAPSPFEAWFPSRAHGAEEVEATLHAARESFKEVAK
jgi:glutamate-1-semialdehyde 2,1-aminomutase